MVKRKLLVALLILGASLVAQPRTRPPSTSRPIGPAAPVGQSSSWSSPPPLKLTAAVGEQLEYLVSWSDYLVAARLRMEIKQRGQFFGRDGLRLQIDAHTVGLVRSLFITVDDEFTSYVNPSSLLPFRFIKKLRQGQQRRDSTILFDHKTGTARVEADKRVPINADTRDVVALLYYVRTLDLSSGRRYRLTGIYEDGPFTVLVTPEEKAVVRTPRGPVDAIKVALRGEEGQGEARRVTDKYRLRLWLSNDEKRLPVLITARPAFGQVRVKLTKGSV